MKNVNRILCITDSLDIGGAETFIMKIFRETIKFGIIFDFIVFTNKKGYYFDEVSELGGKIHMVVPKSKNPIRNFNEIKNIVYKNKYEKVIRLSKTSLDFFELLASKRGGAKVLATRSMSTKTTNFKKETLNKIFRPFINKLSKVKISPSTESAVFMYGKKKVEKGSVNILNNGLDIDSFLFSPITRKKIRDLLGLKNEYIIGHVGRYEYVKNHDFIINTFKKYNAINSNSKLLLIGDGPLFKNIEQKVIDENLLGKVIFINNTGKVNEYLMAMDLFLFPSLYEGLPNAVVEAQFSGLRCLISDTITREVELSDNVLFLSLDESVEYWSNIISENILIEVNRENQKSYILNYEYDIKKVAKTFINLMFNKEEVRGIKDV